MGDNYASHISFFFLLRAYSQLQNRRWDRLYAILSILVVLAGLLVFCVGIFIAIPVVTLASAVVYRWLQYGQKAVTDHPNTQTPVIASYIP